MKIEPESSGELDTKLEDIRNKKRRLWIIVIIMLAAFCVGTAALLSLLWVVFEKILPQGLV